MMSTEKRLTPMRAIRAKCMDCCCGQEREIRFCPMEDCPLWIFRFGKNPNIRREATEKQREKARQNAILLNANRHGSSAVQKSES